LALGADLFGLNDTVDPKQKKFFSSFSTSLDKLDKEFKSIFEDQDIKNIASPTG
jgi:hypothetical protein